MLWYRGNIFQPGFPVQVREKNCVHHIHMTCRAIARQMMDTQFPRPMEQMWRDITSAFWIKWNFPNCPGAIDGTNVKIKAPSKTVSQYFNYKKKHFPSFY